MLKINLNIPELLGVAQIGFSSCWLGLKSTSVLSNATAKQTVLFVPFDDKVTWE